MHFSLSKKELPVKKHITTVKNELNNRKKMKRYSLKSSRGSSILYVKSIYTSVANFIPAFYLTFDHAFAAGIIK